MTRRRVYFALMGTCVALITLAWLVVRLFSTTAAVVMSVVALVIPPIAVVLGSSGDPDEPIRPPRSPAEPGEKGR